jgi:hypothetical protein
MLKFPTPAKPSTPSTQDFLDIEDIVNDIVIQVDGSACLILEVTAINFGLFSEREQEATIYAYAQLLNSLTFSIQIVITSKRKDITDYITSLDAQTDKITSPKLRDQLIKYRDFVKSIVRQGNVLDKKFYISIPFSSLELGIASNIGAIGKKTKKTNLPTADIAERAATNLVPKKDHLIRLLARIGLRARQLSSDELLQLFYDLHNPDMDGSKVTMPASSVTNQTQS